MKNRIFSMIAGLMLAMCLFAVVTASAQNRQSELDRKFARIYERTLGMNKGLFKDLDEVQVGDVIMVPSIWDERDIDMLEISGKDSKGKNDCIYNAVHRYVYGDPTEYVAPPSPNRLVKAVPTLSKRPKEISNNFWLAIIAFAALLFAFWFIVGYFQNKKKNPANYPPMGGNLDNMDRVTAISSLRRFLKEGEILVSLRRGKLVGVSNHERVETNMEFGDNKNRNIWLKNGERVATIVAQAADGSRRTQNLRSACSNGFGSDAFVLPNGWSIEYDETEAEGTIVPPTATNANNAPQPGQMVMEDRSDDLLEKTTVDLDGITKMLEAGSQLKSMSIRLDSDGIKIKTKGFKSNKTKN